MHAPYMNAVSENIPGGDRKIAFDKYHVAAHLGGAVDKVRCDEHRVLRADGDERLKDTKYFGCATPRR
ncbi:MAG: transposase [Nannocystaceae bacterium]